MAQNLKRKPHTVINNVIKRKTTLRSLVIRVSTRVLLSKKERDRFLQAYAHKQLWKKLGLSTEAVKKIERRISYIGWVGHENLGDDALYKVNAEIFKPYNLIPDFGPLYCSKITLLGGGTLLPMWTARMMPNKYNYAYGVGVRDPLFWGKFDESIIEKIKKFKFRYIGVRGNRSKDILKIWGINSEVIGDPCLLLKPEHHEKIEKKQRKIAVNVGSDGLVWGGNEEKVFREVGRFCKMLRRMGYYPVLIPFWKRNLLSIQRISKMANTPVLMNWREIKRVLNFIASCYILIGEKLHSIVFSAAAHTPFIAIEYRPKCRDFAETMGFEKYIIRTDEITSERLMEMFLDLLNNWDEMYEKLLKNVQFYREKLIKFAKLIKKDIKMNCI